MKYETQILNILKSGNPVPVYELVKITHRFGASLFTLREQGYIIDTQPQKSSTSKKHYTYQLISAPKWDGWQPEHHL